ncbi:MAG: sporulation integral membrane protein YtvI [Lachnospiraceae bacterium]|nr:sporulation integral membrane protein YtvI [Lachnospiraceae bacterium]
MAEEKRYGKTVLVGAVTVLIVYLGFRYLLSLFLPLIIAFAFALLLSPVVRFWHRKLRLPVVFASGLTLFFFLGGFLWGLVWLGRKLSEQLVAFFQNFSVYEEYVTEQIDDICRGCDRLFGMTRGTSMSMVERGMTTLLERIQTEVLPALTARTLELAAGTAVILGAVLITLVLTLLLLKDMEQIRKKIAYWKTLPTLGKVLQQLIRSGFAYLRTQATLVAVIATVITVGLLCIGNPYALLLGVVIAIFDAFPMLGTGIIMVPWGIIRLLAGDYFAGIVLILLFVICQILREVLEPKLLGGKLGIHPATALMAIYIGIRLFGVAGVILGPAGLIIIRSVMGVCEE